MDLDLRSELAVRGLRAAPPVRRRAGAGPSDDGHWRLRGGCGATLPMAAESPFALDDDGRLTRDGVVVEDAAFEPVHRPRFYDLETADGVSYEQLARLHGTDVLATTVVQTCIRYTSESTRCRFCTIEESLKAGATTQVKRPDELAEVAEAAWRLDGVRQMVMTTGTSNGPDRGARHLSRCVVAVRRAVPLMPIQVQIEPPLELDWIDRLRVSGAEAIGIHIESLDERVRARWTPGKATVSVRRYEEAWRHAVRVFGRNRVSTYLLVGLGEDPDELVAGAARLVEMGVYPVRRALPPARRLAGHRGWRPRSIGFAAGRRDRPGRRRAPCGRHARRRPGRRMRRLWRVLGAEPGRRLTVLDILEQLGATGARADRADRPLILEASGDPRLIARYRALRRREFVQAQGLFRGHDLDEADADTRTRVLVAVTPAGSVIGGVRIHAEDGDIGWWRGSRLVVEESAGADRGRIGAALVRAACARALDVGALRFEAHVQERQVQFFERLGWTAVRELSVSGQPHRLMRWDGGRFANLVSATKEPLGSLLGPLLPSDRWLGDDGVPVPGSDVVACVDAITPSMVERDPEWAGWCGMLVTAHDLAAMGAEPVGALDALAASDQAHAGRVLRGVRDGARGV